MPRLRDYNEGDSFEARFQFFDADFLPSSPASARYRIDCLTTRQRIRDWTVLTPTQTIDIAVVPADNRIVNSKNPSERRQLVVQSNYGTDNQKSEVTEWTVKNLQGVT